MTCDCGAATSRRQCADCDLAEQYERKRVTRSDTEYEEVIVRVASWDDDLTVYHTDADCVCLNSARGVERRAKRFLPDHVEACPHCEGTVADGHRDPDRSHFEALRAAADGGRDD